MLLYFFTFGLYEVNLSSDMWFPNNECGILTSVDSDEPVQSPFKLGNSKWCSISIITLIENSSDEQRLWLDCVYVQADLSLRWSHISDCWKSHVAAHFKRATMLKFITSWRNVIRIVTSRHGDRAAACLKELSLLFKLLVIEKIHQSYG